MDPILEAQMNRQPGFHDPMRLGSGLDRNGSAFPWTKLDFAHTISGVVVTVTGGEVVFHAKTGQQTIVVAGDALTVANNDWIYIHWVLGGNGQLGRAAAIPVDDEDEIYIGLAQFSVANGVASLKRLRRVGSIDVYPLEGL